MNKMRLLYFSVAILSLMQVIMQFEFSIANLGFKVVTEFWGF